MVFPLAKHSIDAFEILADSFIKAYAGARKVQARKVDILRNSQGESELRREFVIRFRKERILLPAVLDEWAAKAFTNDRQFSRGRFLPYERTDRRRNKGFQSSDRFAPDRRVDRGRSNMSLQEKEVPGAPDSTYPKLLDYNFNINQVELVSAMRFIKEARFLKPIRSDPSQRDPSLWCEYHGTHDHRTGDYRHLHKEVATLLKSGHLREFLSNRAKNKYARSRDNAEPSKIAEGLPQFTINIIFRGNEVNGVTFSAAKKTKISVTQNKRLREIAEDDIIFTEEEADILLLTHNDALVISLNVLDLTFKRVLVDLGSSANIIQWRVLERAKLTGILTTKLLASFNLTSVTTRGEILLPTHAEGVTKITLFEVVYGDMGYNVILERSWIHAMKVVPSTYHQLFKFSTLEGIK
ncbi:uncharacterized protein [Nicotiana tomentosiformis]|uniref:uncharacterized protein n=1 Tax=Nicotiana tomentosiformis TaxID=4098 RepID=UPI00388C935F